MNTQETKQLLQELLDKKNMSHKDLAEKMGLTKFALSKIINNKQKMYLSDFMTLFELTGLLFGEDTLSMKQIRSNFFENASDDDIEDLLYDIYEHLRYDIKFYESATDVAQILDYIVDVLDIRSFHDFETLITNSYGKYYNSENFDPKTKEHFGSIKEYNEYLQLKENLDYHRNQYMLFFPDNEPNE